MYKIKTLIIIYLLLCINISFAQKHKTFRKNDTEFIIDATQFLLKKNIKESKDPFLNDFKQYWNSETISEKRKNKIYRTSNSFVKRKTRPYPTYANYIECLLEFSKLNIDKKSFDTWHNAIHRLLKNKKIKLSTINKLLLQTKNLIKNNIIYKSYSVQWKGKNLIYNYEIVNKKLAINFAPFDLFCFSQRDSSKIINTSGKYFPLEKLWKGKKGKITWEKAGKNPQYEFATFNEYEIKMSKNYFSVDTVKYFNSKLASNGIYGKLQDKTIKIPKPEKAIYPKFMSFNTNIIFKNLFKNVDYIGGINIKGANFFSKTDGNTPAKINILRNDSCFIEAFSNNFSFKNNKITATNTKVKILLDGDIIEHPGLGFNFNNSKRELNLIRNGQGSAQSPYFNYYHNVIMDFELLVWKLKENKIYFKKMYGANQRVAHFESLNYFSNEKYRQLKGMDKENPLVELQAFEKTVPAYQLNAIEYAKYINKPLNQVRQQLMKLSFGGFIIYNIQNDKIKILNRLTDYILASKGLKDYDVIKFVSDTKGDKNSRKQSIKDVYNINNTNKNNAILNLDSYNLKINGVKKITVSDSQSVIIKPKNYKLELKRNLNFNFDGEIEAGSFNMFGNDFHFVYKDFKVHLNNIDSVQIKTNTDTTIKNNRYQRMLVNNVIEKVTGDLSIDDPTNKAGLQDFPTYPIFNSTDTSFVYYDKKNIQNGVYDRRDFYFKLAPYTISKLNKFKPRELHLKGEFVSSNIFPNIKESLTILEDLSLGFVRESPSEGYKVYGEGKGVFRQKVILNRRGLTGYGELDFINSTTKATDFLFLPTKVISNAYSFKLEEGERRLNPNVEGDSIFTKWLPYNEELFVTSNDIPFSMYSNFARLSGTLRLTPYDITGTGRMELKDAKLESQYYSYSRTSIKADTALFKIYDKDRKGFAFEADSINAYIDLEKETGLFTTTISNNISKFPDNEYLCYLNSFMWYMENNNIKFGSKNKDLIAETWNTNKMHLLPVKSMSKFVSTKKGQDSLSFYTPMADYDVTNKIIKANYVYYLDVADATIYPGDGNITIEKNAKINTIYNAKISTGQNKIKHIIENAKIDIFGRYNFSGNGEYKYIDETKKEQLIKLSFIDVDSARHTRAKGEIDELQNFTLSPNFEYKGNVKLRSHNNFLEFNGETKICQKIKEKENQWLKFKALINPKDIRIPIKEKIKNDMDSSIFANIFISNDSSSFIYPSFLSTKNDSTDRSIIKAKGFLTYDKKSNAYRIARKEKLDSLDLPGNNINLYKDKITARGKLNLGARFKFIKQVCSGSMTYNFTKEVQDTNKTHETIEEKQVVLDVMYGINFALPEAALELLQESFIEAKLKMSHIDAKSNYYKLSELIGEEKTDKAISKMNENGYYKDIPHVLEKTLFFNNLSLEWKKDRSAYLSMGKFSIGNIGTKQINRIVNGKIEIKKQINGDKIRIYLYLENEVWYYFEYRNGRMYTSSSDNKYNTIIRTINIKGKKIKKKNQDKEIDENAPLNENEEQDITKPIIVKKYSLKVAPTSLKMNFLQSLNKKKKTETEDKTDDKTQTDDKEKIAEKKENEDKNIDKETKETEKQETVNQEIEKKQ